MEQVLNAVSAFISVFAFATPILVVILTEVAKRIDKIPVTSKNAKLTALILSAVLVIGVSVESGTFEVTNAVTLGAEIVATTVAAIGIYESCKGLLRKVLG